MTATARARVVPRGEAVKAICRLISGLLTPKTQLRLAWIQLAACVVGWPASLFLVSEPPVILSLSWWAVLVTALGAISAGQANVSVSGEEGDK